MSDIAVAWAKAQKCPSARAKATLVHLAAYCDAEGEGWAAVGILALEMEVDDRTVQRGLFDDLMRDAGNGAADVGRRHQLPRITGRAGVARSTHAKLDLLLRLTGRIVKGCRLHGSVALISRATARGGRGGPPANLTR